jgi:hypothetical protein
VRKAVFVIHYEESSGTAFLACARSVASDQINLRIRVECQLLAKAHVKSGFGFSEASFGLDWFEWGPFHTSVLGHASFTIQY